VFVEEVMALLPSARHASAPGGAARGHFLRSTYPPEGQFPAPVQKVAQAKRWQACAAQVGKVQRAGHGRRRHARSEAVRGSVCTGKMRGGATNEWQGGEAEEFRQRRQRQKHAQAGTPWCELRCFACYRCRRLCGEYSAAPTCLHR